VDICACNGAFLWVHCTCRGLDGSDILGLMGIGLGWSFASRLQTRQREWCGWSLTATCPQLAQMQLYVAV